MKHAGGPFLWMTLFSQEGPCEPKGCEMLEKEKIDENVSKNCLRKLVIHEMFQYPHIHYPMDKANFVAHAGYTVLFDVKHAMEQNRSALLYQRIIN